MASGGVRLAMQRADLCGVVRLGISAGLGYRRVPGQRGDLNLHEGEQRERPQHLVQRVVGVDVEDADVAVAAHHPPQVQPCALPLQVLCPLLLLGEEPGAFLLGQVPRDRDVHPDLEEHGVVLGCRAAVRAQDGHARREGQAGSSWKSYSARAMPSLPVFGFRISSGLVAWAMSESSHSPSVKYSWVVMVRWPWARIIRCRWAGRQGCQPAAWISWPVGPSCGIW